MMVTTPSVNVSGAVVVSVTGNDQQYIDDKTLHFRDDSNTFEYYQIPLVENVSPRYVSNTGNSPVKIKGMLFD